MANIIIKKDTEIEIMAEGGRILRQILSQIKLQIKPGMKTGQIEEITKKLLKKYQVKPSFLGFRGYPATLCVSLNEEVVHGIPGERTIVSTDVVSVDLGIKYRGYHLDAAFSLPMDKASKKDKKLVRITLMALEAGIKQARPGNHLGDISSAVQRVAEKAGFSLIRDCTGHGIGKNLHEEPSVPNFGKEGTGPELRSGMVLAIEPMVSAGKYEVEIKSDNWTISTCDKSHTAHFEDTVAITPNGPKILTHL